MRGFVLLRNWECDSVVALMLVSPSPRRLAIRKIMARIATGEVAAQMKLALLRCGFWNPHLHVSAKLGEIRFKYYENTGNY